MSPTVTHYRGHRLLPVLEINLKACVLVILNQILWPDQDLNPGSTNNPLKSSLHCVKLLGQACVCVWSSIGRMCSLLVMYMILLASVWSRCDCVCVWSRCDRVCVWSGCDRVCVWSVCDCVCVWSGCDCVCVWSGCDCVSVV